MTDLDAAKVAAWLRSEGERTLLEEAHHGVRSRHRVILGEVSERDARDQDEAVAVLAANEAARVDDDGVVGLLAVAEEPTLLGVHPARVP
jgi:hypothetical protein